MPEPLDRVEFLHRVADAVDLQPRDVGEVLEELNGHLSDAAAGWRAAGLEADDAERRAIRGLGDPQVLGRELGRARHQRRRLLAAVGGGIWSAVTVGLWAFLFIWLIFGGAVMLGTVAALAVLHGLGADIGNWLTGSAGSLFTVAFTALWFAWMGWVLPGRVARSAGRSVRGVRIAVGVIGLVVGTAWLWTQVQLDMDPVLAVGIPAGPLAFLLAARRSAPEPTLYPRTTLRLRLAVAAGVVLVTVVVGFATAAPASNGSGWGVDTAHIARDPSAVPVLSDGGISGSLTGDGIDPSVITGSISVDAAAGFTAFASRYPTASLEVWPTLPGGDTEQTGPAPIAMASAPMLRMPDQDLTLTMPMPRSPVHVVVALVAVGADGSRVLMTWPDLLTTPAWHGTLFDWWFTGR